MASNNHAPWDLADLSLRLHELAIHTGDLKHSCLGCGHEVMLPRSKAEKNIRQVLRDGAPV